MKSRRHSKYLHQHKVLWYDLSLSKDSPGASDTTGVRRIAANTRLLCLTENLKGVQDSSGKTAVETRGATIKTVTNRERLRVGHMHVWWLKRHIMSTILHLRATGWKEALPPDH